MDFINFTFLFLLTTTLLFDDGRLRRFGCRFVDEVFGEKRETGAEGDESSLGGFIRHFGWVFCFHGRDSEDGCQKVERFASAARGCFF